MAVTLRTPEGEAAYIAHRAALPANRPCPLCEESPIHQFSLWKIITNNFPYDRIAKIHHMLVPFEHLPEASLTEDHLNELREIKNSYVAEHYDWIIDITPQNQSIPGHFHTHLLIGKE